MTDTAPSRFELARLERPSAVGFLGYVVPRRGRLLA